MKTIGLLGGMSWESTQSYYRILNEGIKARLGGLHSAQICLYSVDFAPIEQLQHAGNWSETARILSQAASNIEAGGADFLMIGTNTMHKVADEIEAAVQIPLLHIADATAEKLLADNIHHVGLLGTRFTMEEDFYKGRLQEKYGIRVTVPDLADRESVHRIIYQELCQGIIRPESREIYQQVVAKLHQQGAQAVILGCTEIALLIQQKDTNVPLYDTTSIHAEKAVEWSLA